MKTNFGVRVHFLGEKLVSFLTNPKKGSKWPKGLPRFESRQEAITVCKELCKIEFIHRSEKRGKGDLTVSIKELLIVDSKRLAILLHIF